MGFQRVGILSIGEMGYHWARLLKDHGVEVLTSASGRSEVTRKRAENAGVKTVPLARLVKDADLVVSIVVPSAARKVAAKVGRALAKAGREDCLYLDANAISPMTADAVGQALAPARAAFVDGCIIGSAADPAPAVVSFSGPTAGGSGALPGRGLQCQGLGDR